MVAVGATGTTRENRSDENRNQDNDPIGLDEVFISTRSHKSEFQELMNEINDSFEYYIDNQDYSINKACDDCPDKSNREEYSEYKSKDGESYVLVAGNWIPKSNNKNSLTVGNGTEYYFLMEDGYPYLS